MNIRARLPLWLALGAALASCRAARSVPPGSTPEAQRPAATAAHAAPAPVDVVVIGGGLAGLSAAAALAGKHVVLLEREARLGGRVLTKQHDGVLYEMGALFAYDASWLPEPASAAAPIAQNNPIGLSRDGTTTFANSVDELVRKLYPSPGAEVPEAVKQAFFGIIHPGELHEYVSEQGQRWATTFRASHRAAGNVELIDKLAAASAAELRLGATATSVRRTPEGPEVAFTTQSGAERLLARAVIVATPAPTAVSLLGDLLADSPVRSVRYGAGSVVTLFVPAGKLQELAYVVSPGAALRGLFARRAGERQVLTLYYAAEQARALATLDRAALQERARADVNALGIGTLQASDIAFCDVQHWDLLGTVISPVPYDNWNASNARPAPDVFLAGDYSAASATQMPYGMPAAFESGRAAARAARAYLDAAHAASATPAAGAPEPHARGSVSWAELSHDVPSQAERALLHAKVRLPVVSEAELPPLTLCDVVLLEGRAPRYLGSLGEGTIGGYGYVLLGDHDPSLVQRLLQLRKNAEWQYGEGYGPTAEDDAVVLEGLLEAGVEPASLLDTLDALRAKYRDEASGGFVTMKHGRAAYWSDPTNEVTAHVAYLMHKLAPTRFVHETQAAVRYLLAHQEPEGNWNGTWYSSSALTTYFAVRLLVAMPGEAAAAVERATTYLAKLQRPNGSLADSVTDTAGALLTWQAAGTQPAAASAASSWLQEKVRRGVPAGEPVFHYWFDDLPQGKTFFVCKDRGAIASAWASFALRGSSAASQRAQHP